MAFLIALMAILMAGCSIFTPQPTIGATYPYPIPQPTEDTTYLTPIPEATIFAIKSDGPINTRLQATIIGLENSMESDFGFSKLPMVISVDKLSQDEARKRNLNPNSSLYHGNKWPTDVWFLVLEGEIQVVPPDPNVTPQPPVSGCLYEVFGTNYPAGGVELGAIACPPKTP